MSEQSHPGSTSTVPTWLASLPILSLIGLLALNVWIWGSDASYGPNQIALMLATAAAAICGRLFGTGTKKIIDGMSHSISSAITAMLILVLIGGLTGTWLLSGVVPAMIYYGLKVLSPETFLAAAVVVSAIVSLATGSSWTPVATVGIALLGIGRALGLSEPMIAGAIVSGAYFGDKISPLSDTTNLAAAMAGCDLFTHVRYMLWTTTPSILLTIGIFWYLGAQVDAAQSVDTKTLPKLIADHFNITPLLFAVPASVVVMVLLKWDALVALFVAMLAGAVVAVVAQPQVINEVANVVISAEAEKGPEAAKVLSADSSFLQKAYVVLTNAISGEMKIPVADEKVQSLFVSRGMQGMLNTIWLILCAMCFGGAMEATGMLAAITRPLITFARSTGSLIATTAGTCVFVNVTASDQYLAIVVPGRMFRQTFKDRGLAPQNLSRTLEDAGTVTSVLVPWNTCGATQQAVLGVNVLAFAPYCFFCWISPLMTILFALLNLRIAQLADEQNLPSNKE
ncbi:MAG: Na+/H+ antiporter NhaC family protein [Planctomycetota bacterium]